MIDKVKTKSDLKKSAGVFSENKALFYIRIYGKSK